jgi:DNA-binding NarL/FixJ family response regulator
MSITVFLADDHTVMRNGLQLILQSESDIKVVGEASDGQAAVRGVAKVSPDVVVMDIAMPGLNGIEATKQIAEECPAVRVLILSVHSSAEHIFRALQAGAFGYILKESAGSEVIKAVRRVHLGHRYLSEKISENMIDDYLRQRTLEKVKSPLESLSQREREILQLTAEGKTSTQIGQVLFISPKTAETYRSRLMHKLGVGDLSSLIKFAIQCGVISLE